MVSAQPCAVSADWLWARPVFEAVIGLAFLALSLGLIYVARRRHDLGLTWKVRLLVAFGMTCALMQFGQVAAFWYADPALELGLQTAAAVLAAVTAFTVLPFVSKVLELPSASMLQTANLELQSQIAQRNSAEEALRSTFAQLESRVRQRTLDLVEANDKLVREVAERQRVAEALRHSERLLQEFNDDLESHVARRTAELRSTIEELEAFSYSISHDLRAPLRAINGYSEILLAEQAEKLDQDGAVLLRKIAANSVRMALFIDGLLNFSRLSRGERANAPVDMTELAQSSAAELREQSSREGAPPAVIEIGQLPGTTGDPEMLRQVWIGLLSNAVKFSSKNPNPRVEVEGRIEGDEAVYTVRDNGVGFDMNFAGKLFGVFERLHRAEDFPGVGVGLAIVRRIVRRHEGRIWAQAEPGRGASFHFALKQRRW